jgi:hypothetical protein
VSENPQALERICEPVPLVDQAALRAKVHRAEAVMLERPQLELPVKHHFAKGLYARELFIPKGTLLTGKIHKYSQLNILSQGEISVLTEEGVKRVRAPFTIVSPPGTKRIAYAHEDCVWTTVHGTEETDLERIEEIFIAQSEAEYLEFVRVLELKGETPCLG